MDKYIGRLLDNRYEILEVIGTGGMAVVYKARCHRLNRLVAIKILKDDFLEDEDFRRRFHAESQAVAQLSHPNIVSVYDVSTSITMEADYIVMELIDGITLKQYLEKKGVLNWKETLHFAMQIAKALEHAHSRGIVHRDIKPHNVMVLKNGSVKVADFGIARMMSQGNTLTREALGSVHYISPEQAKGGRLDNRSDIYSLGVVMYEMMSGRPPYDGESPVAVAIAHINGGAVMPTLLNPNIPGGLEQIIMKAMAHNIDHRYTTATRMLADMDEFRKDPTILFDYNTPPMDVVTRLQKPEEEQPKPPVAPRPRPVPTRRPTTAARKQQRATGGQRDRRQSAAARNRATTIAIISCSLAALLAIMIVLIVGFAGGCSPKEQLVQVPLLYGKPYTEIGTVSGLENLVVDPPIYKHDEAEAGTIIGQEPRGGDQVVKGSKLVLTVSLGPAQENATMPDLLRQTQDEAKGKLDGFNINLTYRFKQEYNEEIPEGCVTKTDPEAGVELTPGQEITLWISMGKEVITSGMPPLVEWDAESAENQLKSLEMGLKVTIVPEFDKEETKGKVIRTEPKALEELTEGQEVILYVSKGEETATMPNVVGDTKVDARSLIMKCGFKDPIIEYEASDSVLKDVVIRQSHPKDEEIPLSSEIVLYISSGPESSGSEEPEPVTMDVQIHLRDSAKLGECQVVIVRDGKEVFNQMVAQGTASVTIPKQTGTGLQKYVVTIGDSGWNEWVDFSANG